MTGPTREPTSPDEELLEAESLSIATLLDDEARVRRMCDELRRGFEVLGPIGPAISIFGSARTPAADPFYARARDLARRLGEAGFAIVTGGGPERVRRLSGRLWHARRAVRGGHAAPDAEDPPLPDRALRL